MNLGLFEDGYWQHLLPLTWLRATFELRCGMDRLVDKLRGHFGRGPARVWVRPVLSEVVAERLPLAEVEGGAEWCMLNGRALLTAPVTPPPGVVWRRNGSVVAFGIEAGAADNLSAELFLDEEALHGWLQARQFRVEHAPEDVKLIEYPWTLVLENEAELVRQCRAGGVHEGRIYPGAHVLNPEAVHVARGARIKPGVVLDAEDGPIHVAEDAHVQPNAVLEGPCYIGPGSVIRPGATIRAGTSIGPVCKVGGEIEASILYGYSNKQHDGFLGHSYVGPWVNLGADTVTSDLKNTYGSIRVLLNGVGVETGQHFVGSIIGDYSKTGIGTLLPTGCVIGVASNVAPPATAPKFVPSFAWLTEAGLAGYRLDRAIRLARIVMARRDVHLTDAEVRVLEQTEQLAREVEAAGWS
ncbi:MAG: putative sugar nucleotidyl transferase [Phycisphaerae bacterium]|jgi:UDP-N-acetylglucosamine diphosphorylase/glucosamine-1-phosphate N-acetyltransferase